jgi:uncharacterized membrane protein (DUF4010 family)
MVGETRGVLLAAAAGGLVSSTAVMASNARHAAAGEGPPRLLAAGAMLATAVSITRTVAVVGALNREVVVAVAIPLATTAVAAVAIALLLALRRPGNAGDQTAPLRNPFELKAVLGFAALLAVMEVVARALAEQFGGAGAFVGALVAGLADVDAVTVSITKLAPASLPVHAAALAVLVAVVSNTVSKLAIGVFVGGGRFAVVISAATAAALAAGAAGWLAAARVLPA